MNKIELRRLAVAEMRKWPLLEGWTFGFNRRKKTIGVCRYRHKRIELSLHYLHLSEVELLDTIRHEIAHVIAGPGAGHGPHWKLVAMKVGATPKRCVALDDNEMPRHSYHTYCTKCGEVTAKTYRKRNEVSLARRISSCCRSEVRQKRVK